MNTPKSIILTCKITGKVVKYTNAEIIRKKCEEAGSVEAFVANFTCRGARKAIVLANTPTASAPMPGTAPVTVAESAPTAEVAPEVVVEEKKKETREESAKSFGKKKSSPKSPKGIVKMRTTVRTFAKGPNCTVVEPVVVVASENTPQSDAVAVCAAPTEMASA